MSIHGSGKSSGSDEVLLEVKRQVFHLLALSLWSVPILYFPFWLALLTFVVVIGVNLGVVLKVEPFDSLFSVFIRHLERDSNLHRPALQALYANLGIFISFLIFGKLALVGVVVLAVGDSFSTFVGKIWGKRRIFYSEKKTAEGTLAFFISVYVVLLILLENHREAVLISSLSAFLESFDLIPDDNLILPLFACSLAYLV